MLKKELAILTFVLLFMVAPFRSSAYEAQPSITFQVSMDDPASHYFHVKLDYAGFAKKKLNFKLPAWTPGYYWIMDYAKNVVGFKAETSSGKTLEWDKVDKNNWEVKTGSEDHIVISYDIFANTQSVADPFLDESHAYISPAGVFMHPDGELKQPVTLTLIPYDQWRTISTGLDTVAGKLNVYHADNFDVLYDSPVYIGNQKTISFEVKGRKHTIAMANPASFDTVQFKADLKKIVVAATDLMGDIPYKNYTFIIMGPGPGGLEHRNSTAVFSSAGYMMKTKASYNGWLSFLAHEYFHLYNIKAIRPLALGPFNYDKENLTHMLWVSEGFTVYYEYIILNRAGLLTGEEFLNSLSSSIAKYENVPGHQLQSAAASSYDTWIQFFNKNENAENTTISYYDKGCALGLLLDLKIREETKNRRSLDDVMRKLYKDFYQDKKRGFTDGEFMQVCESVAGTSLKEIFTYATTVQDIDYQRYVNYAGLTVNLSPLPSNATPAPGKVVKRSFQLTPVQQPDPLQKAILNGLIVHP